MVAPAMSSDLRAAVAEYGAFWQVWPQFEQTDGEHRMIGIEVELIGAHASASSHLDPSCPRCHLVRSVLLGIANLMLTECIRSRDALTCDIDSHSNSIMCLPALGNRSAVSVSVYIFWNVANGQSLETNLVCKVKAFLAQHGIHQR